MSLYDYDNSPFGVQGDPEVDEGKQYTQLAAGNYTVNGIGSWFGKCLDDKELPVWIPQGTKMVVRFNLRMQDGTDGPPITCTKAELACVVKAFGGDPKQLPAEESTRYLLMAQELANKAGVARECYVDKNGWTRVTYLDKALPPTQKAINDEEFEPVKYQWEFVEARSVDGSTPVAFKDHTSTYPSGTVVESISYFTFQLVGDEFGAHTPYDGFTFDVRMYNPFDGSVLETPAGKKPATKMGKKGGYPLEVKNMIKFQSLFCPEMASYHWKSDPENSEYGVNEISNPLPVINKYAQMGHHRAVAPITFSTPKKKENKPRPRLLIDDMTPAGGVIDRDAQTKVEMQQSSKLNTLYDFLLKLSGKALFEPTPKDSAVIQFNFTDEGREWAKAVLAPAWAALDLPVTKGSRLLGKLTDEEIDRLMTHLKPPFDVDDEEVANAPEQGF